MVRPELVFGVQAGVSVSVVLFSIAMLSCGRSESVYLPVLTSIVGYWLPAPRPARKPAQARDAAAAQPHAVAAQV